MLSVQPKVSTCLLTCLLMLILSSCKKDAAPENPGPSGVGAKKPTGTSAGVTKNFTIGPSGGTIVSDDKQFMVTIPAGAIASTTNFTVTPVTNTNPGGLGLTYRILPHIIFSKPVTISMNYTNVLDSVSGPGCGLGIAWQDSTGVWQLKKRRQLDQTLHVISVQANHFSDWCVMMTLRLEPAFQTIAPNETAKLRVTGYIPLPSREDNCGVLSSTATDIDIAVEGAYSPPDAAISRWEHINPSTPGAGKLTASGAKASYTASDHKNPASNPVGIYAYQFGSSEPMVARIQIRTIQTGVYLTIGERTWFYTDAEASGNANDFDIQFKKEVNGRMFRGVLAWKGLKAGVREWGDDTQFGWEPEELSPRSYFNEYYNDGTTLSRGAIHITKFGEVGDLIEGNFSVEQSGRTNTESGNAEYLGPSRIYGGFKVVRK